MSLPLPARVLPVISIKVDIIVRQGEPVMFRPEYTFYKQTLVPVCHFCISRVICLIEVGTLHAVEFHGIFFGVGRFGQQQPTLQVVEAESFHSQLDSAFTTYFIHELMVVSQVCRLYTFGTATSADFVDGIQSGQFAIVSFGGRTSQYSTAFSIHQVDVGEAHVGQVSMQVASPVIFLVSFVTGVGDELLEEIAGTAGLNRLRDCSKHRAFGHPTACLLPAHNGNRQTRYHDRSEDHGS